MAFLPTRLCFLCAQVPTDFCVLHVYVSICFTCLCWFTQLCVSEAAVQRCSYRKGVLKIYSKLTGEHPCWSMISIKLLCNFIEITIRHGCSPVTLLHIFRTAFLKNTSEWLLPVSLFRYKSSRYYVSSTIHQNRI